MSGGKKHLYFIYELEHLPELESRLTRGDKLTVVGLDYEVELEMKKRGINFTSINDITVSPDGDRDLLEHIRALALRWYTVPETSFLSHDGILLGRQHEVVVTYYLETLVYYLAVLKQVFAHFPNTEMVSVPQTFHYISDAADPVAFFKERLPEDVIKLLAKLRNVSVEIIPTPVSYHAKNVWYNIKTSIVQFLFRILVITSNGLVNVLQKRRPIRLFASDPWSRLAPFVENMSDVELIMTRRKEMREMGWKKIWKTRARFHHRLDFVDSDVKKTSSEITKNIINAWNALDGNPPFSSEFTYKGISYWPIAKEMFDSLVQNHTEDAINTIENTKKIFVKHDVNCVLLFACTKGYNNIIATVSERVGIPSIELQHALTNTEPSFAHCRLYTRYLASYGHLMKKIYKAFGADEWRIKECGSPRFDHYATPVDVSKVDTMREKLALDNKKINILINVPQIYRSLEYGNYTSYEVASVLRVYAEIQERFSKTRLLLRPRPGVWSRSFYEREEILGIFKRDTRYVQFENLHVLFNLSDIVISGGSTMVLEALLMHKPVIMYLPKLLDHDFQDFEDAKAILVARTEEDLLKHVAFLIDQKNREELIRRADSFVASNFKFDGKSDERIASLIRSLAISHEAN